MRTIALDARVIEAGTLAFAVHQLTDLSIVVTPMTQDDYDRQQFPRPEPGARFVMAWGGRPRINRIGGRPVFGDVWQRNTTVHICLNDGEDFHSVQYDAVGAGDEISSRGNHLKLLPADWTGIYPLISLVRVIPGITLVNGVLTVDESVRALAARDIAQQWDIHHSISHNASAATSAVSTNSVTLGGLTIAAGSDIVLMGHFANSAESAVADISTLTWNGVAFSTGTGAWNVANGEYLRAGMRYLVNPATGAHNLIYTATNSDDEIAVGGTAFNGVDQTTPCRTPTTTSAQGSGAFASVAPTTVSGDEVVSSVYASAPTQANYTAGASQTPNFDINVSSVNVYASDRETATGTTTTMSGTLSQLGYGWIHGATPLIPSTAVTITMDRWAREQTNPLWKRTEVKSYQ